MTGDVWVDDRPECNSLLSTFTAFAIARLYWFAHTLAGFTARCRCFSRCFLCCWISRSRVSISAFVGLVVILVTFLFELAQFVGRVCSMLLLSLLVVFATSYGVVAWLQRCCHLALRNQRVEGHEVGTCQWCVTVLHGWHVVFLTNLVRCLCTVLQQQLIHFCLPFWVHSQ